MTGKLPEPTGATRQRMLDRAESGSLDRPDQSVPGEFGRTMGTTVTPAILVSIGLGVIAWAAFDMPLLTLIPPFLAVTAVLILVAMRLRRR